MLATTRDGGTAVPDHKAPVRLLTGDEIAETEIHSSLRDAEGCMRGRESPSVAGALTPLLDQLALTLQSTLGLRLTEKDDEHAK